MHGKNPYPNAREVLRAVDSARLQLIEAIARRDAMDFIERRRLTDAFYARFGELALRRQQLLADKKRALWRMGKIQEAIHEKRIIPLQEIDARLQEDVRRSEEDIQDLERVRKQAVKNHRMAGLLAEQNQEQTRLYRDIAGKISPEVYPHMDREKIQLYEEAKKAFEQEDVISLQMLHAMSRQMPMPKITGSPEELQEERMRLEERLREVQVKIRLLEEEFPFHYREILNSKKGMEQEEERRKQEIRHLQMAIAQSRGYTKHLLHAFDKQMEE